MYLYYEEPPIPDLYFQGDVLNEVFFPSAVSGSSILQTRNIPLSTISTPLISSEIVALEIHQEKGIIISQSCDVQRQDRGDLVLVSPVRKLADFYTLLTQVKGVNSAESFITQVRDNKINYYFYLPACSQFEESYVDLTTITSINKSLLNINNRVVSLSAYARHWFQHSLSTYLGRPFDQNK